MQVLVFQAKETPKSPSRHFCHGKEGSQGLGREGGRRRGGGEGEEGGRGEKEGGGKE
jgi:hypothetical protein